MDTERPDGTEDAYEGGARSDGGYDAFDDAAAGASDGAAPVTAPAVAAPPRSRLPLATLAGLGVVVAGLVAWTLLYFALDRDYVGISVVVALVVGYVVREVSGRSDIPPRVVAALLTVVLCVVGAVSSASVGIVEDETFAALDLQWWPTFRGLMKEPWTVLESQRAITWAIFGAAVVVAFLSAGPAKPKKGAVAAPAPAAEPVDRLDD